MSTTTRKRCRHGEPCVPVSLKEAFDCLGHHSDRTLAEIAERVGATETTLGKQVSRYDEGNYPTARMIVPLTLASNNDAVVRYLAHAVGGVFFRLPDDNAASSDASHISQLVLRFGQLLEDSAMATADGIITPEESAHIAAEGEAVMGAIASWLAHVKAHAVPGPRLHRAEAS